MATHDRSSNTSMFWRSRPTPITARALATTALLALCGCSGNPGPQGHRPSAPPTTPSPSASALAAASPLPLLYTDLDGTLLDDQSRISAANLAALKRYREAGGKVGVATGRLPDSALEFARAIEADLPLVFGNGAVVTTPTGELIEMKGLSEAEDVSAVCQLMGTSRCKHVFVAFGDPQTGAVAVHDGRCEPPPQSGQLVVKMRARQCEDHAQLVDQLERSSAGRYSVVQSGQGEYFGVAVAGIGVSKGKALTSIAARLGTDLSQLAFIGDSGNDVSAARAVHQAGGTCFAMVNGTADLLATCPRHTSRDNTHGGVGEAAESLLAQTGPP